MVLKSEMKRQHHWNKSRVQIVTKTSNLVWNWSICRMVRNDVFDREFTETHRYDSIDYLLDCNLLPFILHLISERERYTRLLDSIYCSCKGCNITGSMHLCGRCLHHKITR